MRGYPARRMSRTALCTLVVAALILTMVPSMQSWWSASAAAEENGPPTISMPTLQTAGYRLWWPFKVTASDPDGDPLRFTWYWGDGTSNVTYVPEARHLYTQKGSYTLVVWADDITGLVGHNVSATASVRAVSAEIWPTITAFTVNGMTTGLTGFAGQSLNFSGSAKSVLGDALAFSFRFGDGSWYNQSNPETANNTVVSNHIWHSYATAGSFSAYLYVFDAFFGLSTASTVRTIIVAVNDPPTVIPQTNKNGTLNVAMTFSGAAFDPDGDPMRFTWDFGDGSPMKVGQTVSHTYTKADIYTYILYVDDLTGIPGHNVSLSATATVRFPISLAPGWNLVSLPLLGDHRASTLGLGYGDVVVRWDPDPGYYSLTYIHMISPLSMDFSIGLCEGFWIYTSVAKTIYVSGAAPEGPANIPIDVPSAGGWALVGVLQGSVLWAHDLLALYPAIAIVGRFNTATHLYEMYLRGIPMNDFPLEAGRAYWIYCQYDFVLSSGA